MPSWVKLLMVKEPCSPRVKVDGPEDLKPLLLEYFSQRDREEFVVVCLDVRNRVLALHSVSVGSLTTNIVHPREVFKAAVLSNADRIILAHNHPSGDSSPSPEDLGITQRIKRAGDILGIKLLDHLIVGEDVTSLRESGYISEGE